MIREAWFQRRPAPSQKLRPIRWQGYALLIGGILLTAAPMLFLHRFGTLVLIVFPIWLLLCLAILFALVARRTKD